MDNPTTIALSRMTAQARAIELIANNVANASTPGFQAQRQVMADWLVSQRGTAAPPGGRQLIYAQDRATFRDQTQGTLTHTGNPLDLALSGDGYFTLQTPQGVRLTRAGRFTLDASGTLSDAAGNAVLDVSGQPVALPAAEGISVAADGTVSVRRGATNQRVARIAVVTPADPYAMRAEGAALLDPNGPTSPAARPQMLQGAVEDSNVQPITEMTRLITAQRDFQMLTQFVEAEGQRRQQAISRLTDIGLSG